MTAPPPPDRPGAGIAYQLAALVSFVTMDCLIKATVQTLPLAVVMWARFAFHLLFVAALLRLMGRRVPPRTRAPRVQAIRSVCLGLANLFFSAALIHIPLAEAVSSYINTVLRHRRDEAMIAPDAGTVTMSIEVPPDTSAVAVVDPDDENDWRLNV